MTGRVLVSKKPKKLSVAITLGLMGSAIAGACSSGGPEPSEARDQTREGSGASSRGTDQLRPAHELIAEAANRNPVLLERLVPEPEVILRRHGNRVLPRLAEGSPPLSIGLALAGASGGSFQVHPIENPEQSIAWTPLRTRDVEAQIQEDGRLLYENAYPATDVLLTANHNRLVHTIVLKNQRSPADFRWKLEWANGLRQVESSRNETALVNADGHLRLTLREAIITGADSRVHNEPVVLGRDGTASLRIDPLTIAYPAIIHFEIEAPPIAFAIIPPEIIKARMMVLVDTSSSMIWGFSAGGNGFGTNAGGDSPAGDNLAVYCDNNLGGGSSFNCQSNLACTVANGGRNLFPVNDNDTPSRLMATKGALQNVVNANSGLIDFGLMRFRESSSACSDPIYCCESAGNSPDVARCTNGSQSNYVNWTSGPDITYSAGACAFGQDPSNCPYCIDTQANGGGRILVAPGSASGLAVRNWVDYVEDACSQTGAAGGPMRNPELRADGYTPLAYAIETARDDWYQPIHDVSKPGGCDTNDANCDPLLDCRPYVLVVLTDGEDYCGADASPVVETLRAVNDPDNPVTIYTMGMGATSGLDVDELNEMAVAGGVGPTAPIAQDQSEIEAAFADIVAETVKFEVCNALDDNCNNRVDEGLNVYQECAAPADCGSNDCDLGRCACTTDAQCASGYSCAADNFCRPACSVGTGVCRNTGIRKCGSTGGQCCIDDGELDCSPLAPLAGTEEICNRIDDDCDGQIDEGFPDGCTVCVPRPEVCNGIDDDCDNLVDGEDDDLIGVGAPCGTDEGICSSGTINCVDGTPVCEDDDEGTDEVCNGLDDDCDGSTDGQTQTCYTGPDETEDVGVCHGGSQVCVASPGQPGVPCTGDTCWGPCVGEVTPTLEICDSQDNDCDGETDEGVPAEVQRCTGHGDCQGSGNCVNDACRCDSGNCAAGFECGGDGVCHPTDGAVTGDQCCDENFNDLCGVGQCAFGQWTCTGAQVTCLGSTGPSNEVCDGIDNDCDGEVDEDLQGVGEACDGEGDCGGILACVVEYDDNNMPVGGTVTCIPTGEGTPEICDNVDNDCDGEVDEMPDIAENDPNPDLGEFGGACEEPKEGMDFPPCRGGTWQCIAGQRVCRGVILPGTEVCDGQDNDCDGETDEETCRPDGMCIDGVCRAPCGGGEFPCPFGEVCADGFCVPAGSDGGTSSDASGGTGGTSASDGAAGADASGGSGTTDAGDTGGSGGTSAAGSGGSDGSGGSQALSNNASGVTTSSGSDDDDSYKVYGLASGGGGCACRMAEPAVPGELALLLGIFTAGGVLRRRRTSPRSGS